MLDVKKLTPDEAELLVYALRGHVGKVEGDIEKYEDRWHWAPDEKHGIAEVLDAMNATVRTAAKWIEQLEPIAED